jgi:serine/threonine-protein kinase RsbW
MGDALARFWQRLEARGGAPDAGWRAQFQAAVMEIAGNVVRHAYPPGHKPGNVKLRLRLYTDRVEALLTDKGLPFEQPTLAAESPEPAEPALADPPTGGPGLASVRAAVDFLHYSRRARGSNRWRLVKRLPRSQHAGAG